MPGSVRYIVSSVDDALPFYTEGLAFRIDMRPAPSFAALSLAELCLLLNQSGTGGQGKRCRMAAFPRREDGTAYGLRWTTWLRR